MYISPSQYSQAFQEIKRTSSSHSTCKLIIFVSCLNIDSICTGKILSIVFKKNLIQYQLIPIVGYTDLKKHYEKLDHEITNVILIGCGSMIDLESFLDIDPKEYLIENYQDTTLNEADDINQDINLDPIRELRKLKRKIYVIDGHRPWNLGNIFGSSVIICFDDGFIDANLIQERESYLKLIDVEESDDEESSDESSSDEDNEEEIEEEEIIINSSDDEETNSRKRRKIDNQTKNLKKQRRKQISNWEDDIESYYNQGTTIITSSTATIYALLSSIGEANIENLWLSIIGTSSLDNHYPEVYDKIQPLFKDEVHRLNPSNVNTSNSIDKSADSTSLSIEKDYHLFLLRHWTLYDSFFYSSHVNSKLNLWTEDGKKRLHKLFAKMGVSLSIAQQKWLYMDISIKKQLPFIFSKYLPSYGLEGLVRDGFIRTFGFAGQLSAMECVESLTALLECDKRLLDGNTTTTTNNNNNNNKNSSQRPNNQDEDEEENNDDDNVKSRIEEKEKIWVNNFWSSWDAINISSSNNFKHLASNLNSSSNNSITNFKKLKGLDLLIQGLDLAKQIQQIIFKTGMSLLERKLTKNLRLFRLCVLNDGSIPDLSIFNNPLILSKLGAWLLDNITEIEFSNFDENNNVKSLKPLVLASLDVASDTYLVIALAPKYPRGMSNATRVKLLKQQRKRKLKRENEANGITNEEGEDDNSDIDESNIDESTLTTRLNTFSVAFQKVAATSGAKVRIDSFDSSVIEIRRDDLSPFLEKLTLSGLI